MLKLMLLLSLTSGSQDLPTRAEELKEVREQKAESLRAPTRTTLERALYEFKERRVLERFQEGFKGFRPLLGGMRTGSGFAAGTSYEAGGFRASAQSSLNGYQKYDVQFTVPRMVDDRFFADFRGTYRNYTQERFFGIGKTSNKDAETNYRLEDTNYVGRIGFAPAPHVHGGVLAGWVQSNIGSGTSNKTPSVERMFTAEQAPALLDQPNHFKTGAFFEVDYRDQPNNPRSGGYYSAQWTSFQDRKLGHYDFSQYDVEVNQYFPFLNERRVFAIRGKTSFTRTADGKAVPFFMQPTLGGAEDLRGFREYRFRDRNMVVLNAEYRWEAFSGLDLAAFVDAGQVAARPTDIDFADLQKSYGVGFRFNTAKSVFLRMDVGFSKEGRQVFLKFSHVF